MTKYQSRIVAIAAFFAFTAVCMWAYGSRFLREVLSNPDNMTRIEVGVRFQIFHALAILILSLYADKIRTSLLNTVVTLLSSGIVFFCFSMYIVAIADAISMSAYELVNTTAPIGILFFISAWGLLLGAVVYSLYYPDSNAVKKIKAVADSGKVRHGSISSSSGRHRSGTSSHGSRSHHSRSGRDRDDRRERNDDES